MVDIGRRVFELTEFLVDILGVTDTGATFPYKTTLHIGCHSRRELGAPEQPMKLLGNVRGLTYCELPNIEECCGFGGTFSVKMPGTSLAMGKTKVENIVKSGADVRRFQRHQLPHAHRRHFAPQSGHATYPHHAHRRRARRRLGKEWQIDKYVLGVGNSLPTRCLASTCQIIYKSMSDHCTESIDA